MSLSKPGGGGSVFAPKNHLTTLALLIEPKAIRKAVPHTYNGKSSTRDEVTADITVFSNQGALDAGKPTEILKDVRVVHGMLASELETKLGSDEPAMVAVVRKTRTQAGEGFVFRAPEDADFDKVAAYFEKRAEAAANAPSFD